MHVTRVDAENDILTEHERGDGAAHLDKNIVGAVDRDEETARAEGLVTHESDAPSSSMSALSPSRLQFLRDPR